MIKIIAIILTGSIFLLYGCYNDKEELLYGNITCGEVNTSFASNISTIIQTNCNIADCHGAGSANGPGPLTTYTQIKNAAVQIQSAVVSRYMPLDGSLTPAQIKAISCWVDAGAPNN